MKSAEDLTTSGAMESMPLVDPSACSPTPAADIPPPSPSISSIANALWMPPLYRMSGPQMNEARPLTAGLGSGEPYTGLKDDNGKEKKRRS